MMVPLTLTDKAGGREPVAYPPGLLSRRVTARGRSITLGPASCDRNPSDPFSNCLATGDKSPVPPALSTQQDECQFPKTTKKSSNDKALRDFSLPTGLTPLRHYGAVRRTPAHRDEARHKEFVLWGYHAERDCTILVNVEGIRDVVCVFWVKELKNGDRKVLLSLVCAFGGVTDGGQPERLLR